MTKLVVRRKRTTILCEDDNNNCSSRQSKNCNDVKEEIHQLIKSPGFKEFVLTIQDQMDNGLTFNELLSSPIILQAASKLLRESRVGKMDTNCSLSNKVLRGKKKVGRS